MHIKRKVEKYVPHKFGKSTIYINNSLHIFMCIWRLLLRQKTQGHYAVGAPPTFYVPMETFLFYEMGKKQGNKKESS
jgi:hypothetical protein